MNNILEQRRTEFRDEYEHQEAFEVKEVILEIGDMISTVFGPKTADQLMLAAYRLHVKDPEIDEQAILKLGRYHEVRKLWAEIGLEELSNIELVQFMAGLHGYAFYGLPAQSREDYEDQFDANHGAFLFATHDVLDWHLSYFDLPSIESTIDAAQTRKYLIDESSQTDGGTIHIDGLASLAGVTEKTVRNLLAPSSGSGIHVDKDGRISASDAKRWLEGRSNFRNSVWQLADEPEGDPSESEDANVAVAGEVLFVPVSKDGSIFSPDLADDGVFNIGPKGHEELVEEYRVALERLQVLDRPAWRRPTEGGRWGLVTATHWLRKTATELGLKGEGE